MKCWQSLVAFVTCELDMSSLHPSPKPLMKGTDASSGLYEALPLTRLSNTIH